jgi:hypothetical protein
MDDLKRQVLEFQQWHSNAKGFAAFYRASAVRTEELARIADESKTTASKFPQHFNTLTSVS